MSSSFEATSLINSSHVGEGVKIVRQDANYVCLYIPAPTCIWNEDDFKDKGDADYRKHSLRLYLPRKVVIDERASCTRLIVMINGLNEVDRTTHYDQLAMNLADHGIGTVLMPLPEHLFRNGHYRFKEDKGQNGERIKVPEDKLPFRQLQKESIELFRSYLQLSAELDRFILHIRNRNTLNCKPVCEMYRSIFSKDCRISLLGYSLGGLGALSYFLTHQSIDNQACDIETCFLLNSGSKLSDINTTPIRIKTEDWDKLYEDLKQALKYKGVKNPEGPLLHPKISELFSLQKIDIEEDEDYWLEHLDMFQSVFMGELSSEVKLHYDKIHFILGGGDDIVKVSDTTAREGKHGMSVIQIPKMPHLLSEDQEWFNWVSHIGSHIAQLEQKTSSIIKSPKAILSELRILQREFSIFETVTEPGEAIKYKLNVDSLNGKVKQFWDIYLAATAYWETEAIAKYVINYKLCGQVAIDMGFASFDDVILANERKNNVDQKFLELLGLDDQTQKEVLRKQRKVNAELLAETG